MSLNLPYNAPEFVPYGAPNKSSVVNAAPIQIQKNVEYLKGVTDAILGNVPVYSSTTTYNKGDLVSDDGGETVYSSKIDNNVGNPLTDLNSWEVIPMSNVGGASLPAGGLSGQALVKLSDADDDIGWRTITSAGGTISINTTSVRYDVKATSDGQTVISFPGTLSPNSSVFVEGILLQTSEYSISGSDITLVTAVNTNAVITVLYEGMVTGNTIREDVTAISDGQTIFTFSNTPTIEMMLYVDGLALETSAYSISGSSVILNTSVNTGAIVTLISADDTVVRETVTATEDGQNIVLFTSDFSPAVNVYVDGILKPYDTYTVDGKKITLFSAINSGSIVQIEEGGVTITSVTVSGVFVKYVDLNGTETTVTIPDNESYTPGSATLIVSLNGIELRLGVDYIETSSTEISLNISVSNGDCITFRKIA